MTFRVGLISVGTGNWLVEEQFLPQAFLRRREVDVGREMESQEASFSRMGKICHAGCRDPKMFQRVAILPKC